MKKPPNIVRTHCRNGHDIRVVGRDSRGECVACRRVRQTAAALMNVVTVACATCGTEFRCRRLRRYCSAACRRSGSSVCGLKGSKADRGMSASQADAFLERAVSLETEPPWVRHPVGWD